MRCETARKSIPETRADEHVRGCAGCTAWVARVGRAAALADAWLGAVPSGLASRVVEAATKQPEPEPAAVLRKPRPSPRWLAAAASFLLIAGVASAWFVGGGPEPAQALAAAADETKRADSARFTFQGDFAVELRVPDDLIRSLEDAAQEGLRDLERAVVPPWLDGELRKGIADGARFGREYLGRGIEAGADALGGLRPGATLRLSGEGAFAARDRVRMSANLELLEPAEGAGAFEFVRAGDEIFVRAEGAGWRALPGRLPAQIIRPVGLGLGRLADWIRTESGRAEPLGRESLDGVETERYRLRLPSRQRGSREDAEVWVGADDGYVHRVLISHRLVRSFATVSARIDVRLFDHGAKLDIRPPAGAEPASASSVLFPGLEERLSLIDDWVGPGLPGPGA